MLLELLPLNMLEADIGCNIKFTVTLSLDWIHKCVGVFLSAWPDKGLFGKDSVSVSRLILGFLPAYNCHGDPAPDRKRGTPQGHPTAFMDADKSFPGVAMLLQEWVKLIDGSAADLDTLHTNLRILLETRPALADQLNLLNESVEGKRALDGEANVLQAVLQCSAAREAFWEVIAPLGSTGCRGKLVDLLARRQRALLPDNHVTRRVRFKVTHKSPKQTVRRLRSPPPPIQANLSL
jgi:hypothetical protein